MAIQYVQHASGNAMWCGIIFTLRAALEMLYSVLLAPWLLLRSFWFEDGAQHRPSVHHAEGQAMQ